jgi:predicted unusual protein kinase regulating ubiquinone biosynthesis (AarF/ABC1/UbiB family)
LMEGFMAAVERPPRIWSLVGSIIRGFIIEQGPATIKFGQILSMREEIPPTIRKELALLQDRLPPMGPDQVRKLLEKELGKPVEVVFEYVEWTPIAAASLAQVHKAKLRIEQEEVALKIRRPYLEGIVALDTIIICDIMVGLTNLFLPLLRKSSDSGVFTSSYRESLEQEIDLVLEARYQEQYRRLVMSHPIYRQTNYVARVYSEYTTTKLIVMELVKNYHRMDRLIDELTPQQLLEFATTKIEGYSPDLPLQLVFSQMALCIEGMCHWGLSHGDIHLGNLYAIPPEKGTESWKIFLCDFGMMMDFDERERLTTLQALIDLTYYCQGDILAGIFTAEPGAPVSDKQMKKAKRVMRTIYKKHIQEPQDGQETLLRVTIQPNSPTNILSAIVYGSATLGLKEQPSFCWLLLKNFSYAFNIGLTLSTNISGGRTIGEHPLKFLKDWTMAELDELDIADLRGRLPEKLRFLRRDDRKQVLRALATGEEVVPNKKIWAAPSKDVRFGKQEKPALAPPTSEVPRGDGGGTIHIPDTAEVMSPYDRESRL